MSNLDAKFRLKDDNGKGLSKNDFTDIHKSKVDRVGEIKRVSSVMPMLSNQSTSVIFTAGQQSGQGSRTYNYQNASLRFSHNFFQWNQSGYSDFGVIGSSSGSLLGKNVCIQFETDAIDFELKFVEYNSRIQIRVNGDIVENISYGSTGAVNYRRYRYSDRKVRLVEIFGFNIVFGGVVTEMISQVLYPTRLDERLKVAFFSDSYGQGVGANSPRETYANHVADILDFNALVDGIGGAGWLSSGGTDVVTRLESYILASNQPPKVIISAFGYNDAGGDVELIGLNIQRWINRIRTYNPSCSIVMVSPWTPVGSTSNLSIVKGVIQQKCIDNSCTFVNIDNLINSYNKTVYTGNDNVHPLGVGHEFLGEVLARMIHGKI